MQEISSSITFEIQPGETVPMMVTKSTRLTVQGTAMWVTRSNDTEDYWLEPGDCLRLRRGERLWLSAEGGRPATVAFWVAPRRQDGWLDSLARVGERLGLRMRSGWRTV
ncbi:DUF2917 domain-containing protein [Trinickia terrae]|uniref:DUF2917 domain-containing protein n=1 Tax=Trinickia terrae TaxID=2571161 RepID=A0A4V5PKV9_9BURK|nr:DUF2917 domain-containing protein [Trinickia terrae]TKC89540.1 DUF2917 domain-containing protein [Trinickia terrae]